MKLRFGILAALGVSLAGCQSLSGVDDLKVVSDAEYEAADPDGPGGDGTMKPPNPGGDDTPEPPPAVDDTPEPPNTTVTACAMENCSTEIGACVATACFDALNCAVDCGSQKDCRDACVAGLSNAEFEDLRVALECTFHCAYELEPQSCSAGVYQFCGCLVSTDSPCNATDLLDFDSCCLEGSAECGSATGFECFAEFETGDISACADAANVCFPDAQ